MYRYSGLLLGIYFKIFGKLDCLSKLFNRVVTKFLILLQIKKYGTGTLANWKSYKN